MWPIAARLGISRPELGARRRQIVREIAPIAASVGTPDSGRSPLDCERAGRRLRSSGG